MGANVCYPHTLSYIGIGVGRQQTAEMENAIMRKRLNGIRFFTPALVALGVAAFAPEASADATCVQGRCSTASARLKLEGKEALYTNIDTGWMPSCDNGQDHCNKGLQVRAGIALSPSVKGGALFTADTGASAAVQASWEDTKYLVLSTDTIGKDSTLTVAHSLLPQAELFVDIGPFEQGYTFTAQELINKIPGAHYDYQATAAAPFEGWAFGGASVVVPPPTLQNSQLFSVDLSKFPSVIDKAVDGSLAIHARTSPTFTYKTTKVIVGGKELAPGALTQFPFPAGDFDFLEFPATIEGQMSAKGEIEVIPSATLARLGDMNFSPAVTITFSSVKVTKAYDSAPQKYTFPDKTIRIPLPNVKRPLEGLDGGSVLVGGEGTVPAIIENTGEAQGLVATLESSDKRFVVPSKPIALNPKSKTPLNITFRPDGLGRAEAIITAKTNDPDSPELTFKVTADGVNELPDGPNGKKNPGELEPEAGADSGCGCKTAGSTSSTGYAGLGAAMFGLAALIRRRRR
jgi:MYXO-CTERM domain-containing protein